MAIPMSHYISMQPESLRKLQCDFEGMGLRRGGNSSQHQLPQASLGHFLKASWWGISLKPTAASVFMLLMPFY